MVAVAKEAAAAAAAVVAALRRCLRSCVAVAAAVVDAAAGNVGNVEGCWSLAAGLCLLDHLKLHLS